mmetsp:Transcript_15277/g.33140  ORF Transcript_15277/g.33140 Transcript_15277/m.33140 type:complete len:99 (-) Transcript_15277:12-308(-)
MCRRVPQNIATWCSSLQVESGCLVILLAHPFAHYQPRTGHAPSLFFFFHFHIGEHPIVFVEQHDVTASRERQRIDREYRRRWKHAYTHVPPYNIPAAR